MERSWIPRILRPDFCWSQPAHATIMVETPPQPFVSSPRVRWLWGLLHRQLARFSELYCSWFGFEYCPPIFELPFGLILKWGDRVRIEEAIAMQMARKAGMPVPLVLCYGEIPSDSFRPCSILMTRLPGWSLENSDDKFVAKEEQPWSGELKKCLQAMRKWKSPFRNREICSALGTEISTQRVPGHAMGPFADEKELHDYLLAPASSHAFSSLDRFHEKLNHANKIRNMSHNIVFTHGDLKAHNILVDDEYHLTGFLDWECAGWQPEYWDFTTAMRFGKDSWWYQGMSILGGDHYAAELECDRALNNLTADSYIGM